MGVAVYLFWFFAFIGIVFYYFRKILKELEIALTALHQIASTNYDMNKLVCIAIKALNDIDNLK